MRSNFFRNFLLGLAAAITVVAAVPTHAASEVVLSYNGVYNTYTAVATGLTPASSPTDFLTLTGSATKTIRVVRAECTGVATAAGTNEIRAVKRSTANSGGTASTLTAAPLDSNLSAASAVAKSYTANPTTGTLVGNIGSALFTAGTTAAAASPALFTFGVGANYPVVLRGTSQVFALNGAATSFGSGTSLSCAVTWQEL